MQMKDRLKIICLSGNTPGYMIEKICMWSCLSQSLSIVYCTPHIWSSYCTVLQVQCSHRLPHDAAGICLVVFGIEEGPPRIQ